MRKRNIDIFSDEVSVWEDQISYQDAFLARFGDKIDYKGKSFPFYFDDCDAVDATINANPTIRGICLGRDTWAQITKKLLKYFHVDE